MKKASHENREKDLVGASRSAQPNVLAIGCGGAGCNTISRMVEGGVKGAETVAVNTDAQDLLHTNASRKIMIGRRITGGLGSGADPEKGRNAAWEDEERLGKILSESELVFLTCGLGGGTGTGAGPVLTEIAKRGGAVTVAVVTLPFQAEGERRSRNAAEGLSEFRDIADTIIVVPDDKLLEIAPNLSLDEAFELADSVLMDTIGGITELMAEPGLINLDFEDVRTTFEGGGMGVVGFGESSENDRAEEAVEEALTNPLLDMDIKDAMRALVSITGSPNMTLEEAENIAGRISGGLSRDARMAWGAMISDDLKDTISVMIMVSGAGLQEEKEREKEVPDLGLKRL